MTSLPNEHPRFVERLFVALMQSLRSVFVSRAQPTAKAGATPINGAVALAAQLKQSLDGSIHTYVNWEVARKGGTTQLVAGVARAMASMIKSRILVIDFNLRTPKLHD